MKKIYVYHRLAEPVTVGIVGVLTILLSIFWSNILLLTILLFYLILVAYCHFYIRKISTVYWETHQQRERLFIDEKETCFLEIHNPTPFLIERLTFHFQTDEGLLWTGENVLRNERTKVHYQINISLNKYESKRIPLQTTALKRGTFRWADSGIIVRDPFGLITLHLIPSQNKKPNFMVYPKIVKVAIPETKQWKHGFRKAAVSPLYDESKIIGVKEYENEGFRAIHWGATAKTGQIASKKYQFTQTDRYAIYINLSGKNGFMLRTDIEYLIEIATGLCKQLLSQDCSFEIWINRTSSKGITHISSGKSRKQLRSSLELFASITENDIPISSSFFYATGFRNQEPGAIPLIIGDPPYKQNKQNPWLQVYK